MRSLNQVRNPGRLDVGRRCVLAVGNPVREIAVPTPAIAVSIREGAVILGCEPISGLVPPSRGEAVIAGGNDPCEIVRTHAGPSLSVAQGNGVEWGVFAQQRIGYAGLAAARGARGH